MSSNNFLLIKKNHKGTAYGVQECDADTGFELHFVGTYKTLEEAISGANEYEKESEADGIGIEYGIKIDDL